jgi:hypothetical protein
MLCADDRETNFKAFDVIESYGARVGRVGAFVSRGLR